MSSYLRKSVDMPPAGVTQPGSAWDYRAHNNAGLIADSKTHWVRFWAEWPQLQPDPNIMPDALNNPGRNAFLAFDDQVNQARANGRNVIITSYLFPRWANGTQNLAWGSREEVEFGRYDRMREAEYNRWVNDGRPLDPERKYSRKLLEYRVPDDLTTTSPWARWIGWLINRYRDYPDGRVVCIELCNEPNLQMWPISDANSSNPWAIGSDLAIDCPVAQMMQTAQSVANGYGMPNYLMAPATADDDENSRLRGPYNTFFERTFDTLQAMSFQPHSKFAWSHHNYTDVTYDQWDNAANSGKARSPNRAAWTRRRLVARGWNGFGGASNPGLFITEGGVNIDVITGIWGTSMSALDRQAWLIQRNWNRMVQNGNEGAGIGMVSNYLMYTTNVYNSGLREKIRPGEPDSGAARPAYGTWKSFPEFN